MFKATEFERKISKINIHMDLQINLSLRRTSDHYLSVSPVIVMRSCSELKMYIYMCAKFLEGKQIMKAEKISCRKNHWISCRKNHWNTMTACMQHPYWNRELRNPQQTMPLVHKITFKQIVKCYPNTFKKHWNNTGTICLNVILPTWVILAQWVN